MDFLSKVLSIAENNERIRLVVMNGSRVNPNIEPDRYQDYDLVFYVENYRDFLKDVSFIDNFGEVLVKQTTDDQRDGFLTKESSFIYMMQYLDGTRLDLTIRDVLYAIEDFHHDSLTKVLLDKEGMNFKETANESSYYVKPVSKAGFDFTVNEFFWVLPYVGKGLARKRIFYALKHLDIIREELEHIIDWWIGEKYNYQISVGKGKYKYQDLLPKGFFELYVNTYANCEKSKIRTALFSALELFDCLARDLADKYDWYYDRELKNKMIKYLKEIYML